MSYLKTMLCLASSSKHGGRCVAGRELDGRVVGPWIRPVSARPTQEISRIDRCFPTGAVPELLEIVDVPLSEHRPRDCQTENHLIDSERFWQRRGRATWEQLESAVEEVEGPLWNNGQSSFNGDNDQVLAARAAELGHSLRFIRVRDLVVTVAEEGAAFGNPRRAIRARFHLGGARYTLSVTDPWIQTQLRNRPFGTHAVGEALLCVSLGEIYEDGCAYKLVASLITRKRLRRR